MEIDVCQHSTFRACPLSDRPLPFLDDMGGPMWENPRETGRPTFQDARQ